MRPTESATEDANDDTLGEATFVESRDDARDRRASPRYDVELEVDFATDHKFYSGLTSDISVGGLFVATHRPCQRGDRVEFSVRLPDEDEPIRGVGEVRWTRAFSETSDSPPGMGLQFVDLSETARAAIERHVERHETLFWEE